jgi:hypothetical protein
MTDYTADGLLPTIDWTKAHEVEIGCYVISKIVDGRFKRVFDLGGKPFSCQIPDFEKAIEAALKKKN